MLDATVPDGPIILVGHSMGGMTIMAFAEQYPEWFGDRVTGVVLISTSAGLIDKTKFGLPTLVARVSAPFFPLWGGAARLGGGTIDRARVRVVRPGLAAHPPVRLRRRPTQPVVGHLRGADELHDLGRDARPSTCTRSTPTPASRRCRRCAACPVLVIVGDQDYLTPVTHSEEILRHLPDAELVKVDNSGHVVMLEKADEVNDAMLPFLEKIS